MGHSKNAERSERNLRYKYGGGIMSFEMPIIILLLVANVLWFIVGWGKGFEEGKREGVMVGKNFQRVSENAR